MVGRNGQILERNIWVHDMRIDFDHGKRIESVMRKMIVPRKPADYQSDTQKQSRE